MTDSPHHTPLSKENSEATSSLVGESGSTSLQHLLNTGAAFGVAGALMTLVDVLTAPNVSFLSRGTAGILAASVAAALIGTVGIALGAVRHVLKPRHPILTLLVSLAAGAALTLSLVDELAIRNRWAGKTKADAQTALYGSIAAGLILFFALALTQIREEKRPWFVSLAHRNHFTRLGTASLFAIGAAGMVYVDRTVWPDSYPYAHDVLRALSWLLAALVIDLLRAVSVDTRSRKHRGLLIAALLPGAWLMCAPLLPVSVATLHVLHGRPFSKYALQLVRRATDLDRDGYSSFFAGGDCAPFDKSRHAMAHDIPKNGQDENCTGRDGDSAASSTKLEYGSQPVPDTSIVVITIDSLRPDHMSVYGYQEATTPQLAAWSTSALRFDRAYTAGGWTSLAIPAMLRGRYPRNMVWTYLDETSRMRLVRKGQPLEPGEWPKKTFALPLDDPNPPMQEVLHRRGMKTAAVVDDGYTGYFDKELGAFGGFDDYLETDEMPADRQNDEGTTSNAIMELKKLDGPAPFFLWVHYFGTHTPSTSHKSIPRFGEGKEAAYDHEIAFMDQQVSRLLAFTDAMQEKRRMVVMVMADHGEEFGPQLRYHGLSAKEAAVRIPLFVRGPGFERGHTDRLTSIVDIAPTVFQLTGTLASSSLDGRTLTMGPAEGPRFVDTWRFDAKGRTILDLATALDGTTKCTINTLDLNRWCSNVHDRELKSAPELEHALDAYLEKSGAIEPHL